MKRTARYESRPLNRGKRRLLLDLLDAFSRVKDLALSSLGRVTSWDYLDNPRALRDAMKSRYTLAYLFISRIKRYSMR